MDSEQHTNAQNLAKSETAYAAVMLMIAAKYLPEEFLQWDPEAIRMDLELELKVKLSDVSYNRLMAAVSMVNDNAFYVSLPSFVMLVNAMCGGTPPGVVALPDAFDVTWGITEGLLIWPPDPSDENPFAAEIVDYIEAVVKREGIINPPDVLRLGLREGADALLANIHAEFSDDPTMYNAIADTEKEKTAEINQDLKENLRSLVQQLTSIGNRSVQEVANGLFSDISQEAKSNSTLHSVY